MPLIISIDIGTTRTKATLFNLSGVAQKSYYQSYGMLKKSDGTATQDPTDIFQAVLNTLKQALDSNKSVRTDLLAVTFSSAMHSLIALDKKNMPLTPVITWADTRATPYAEKLAQGKEGLLFYQKTGTPIHPMTPLTKIMYLKTEEPLIFQNTAMYTDIKGYILFQLFGKHSCDYSLASGTGYFNLHTLQWDLDILNYLGITPSLLPKVCPPTSQLHQLNSRFQKELELTSDIPFIIGASDGALANLGTNCLSPQVANLSIGTSAALRFTVKQPLLHPEGKTFCYLLTEDYYVIGGAANNGGLIIDWARTNLAQPPISYQQFMTAVTRVPAGAEGLFFHPYLTGERAPIWNGQVRGGFTGLSLTHSQDHFFRAIIEGICYNIADIYQQLTLVQPKPLRITASGGFANSALWKQLLADILGQQLTFQDTHESSGLGAMILALKSLALIPNLEASQDLAIFKDRSAHTFTTPNPNKQVFYQKQLKIFQDLKPLILAQQQVINT